MAKKKDIKPAPRTDEEMIDELRQDFYPENPEYFFEVGEEVPYGAINKAVVSRVFDGGRFYKLDITSTHTNYGDPYEYQEERFVPWVDIRKKNLNPPTEFNQHKLSRLDVQFTQREISALLSITYKFGCEFNPDYQRGYVWTEEDKVLLIDTIFKGVDIGKFVFIQHEYPIHDGKSYEILDGKQRMRAILDFYEDRFAYKGYKFSGLHPLDRAYFRHLMISVGMIREVTKEEILELFIRLNTTGRVMDREHLNAIEEKLENLKTQNHGKVS